jgi:hypothetical protein
MKQKPAKLGHQIFLGDRKSFYRDAGEGGSEAVAFPRPTPAR